MPNILLANHYDDVSFEILKSCVPDGYVLAQLSEASQVELAEAVSSADYLIASGRLQIGHAVLENAANLRMIARTGVGLDAIDQTELHKRGIPLYVNAGVNSESVAEHTLLLILAALRNLVQIDGKTKGGQWLKRPLGVKTHELSGKKVFVAGLGSVGRRVIQLLGPFGCQVDGSDFVERGRLPKEVFDSDIVTLHCPLLPTTRHLLDSDTIMRLKPGCIVVNTARGGLIDEQALSQALSEGRVGYACLDVRENEPCGSSAPFDGLENVILTSHVAGITYESFENMMRGAVDNIVAFDRGDLSSIEQNRVEL